MLKFMMIRLNRNSIFIRKYLIRAVIAFISLAGTVLLSQGAPVTVSSAVDKSRIKIGDIITYTVTVSYNQDVQVKPPGSGENLGTFEIRDYKIDKPVKKGNRVYLKAEYKISTFSTGNYFIPPLTIYYRFAGDSTASAISTEKIKITVDSMKPSEEGDIRDIKGPIEISETLWEKIKPVVFGAGVVLLILLGYLFYRFKKKGISLIPRKKEPERPPHQIAFERLDNLLKLDLVTVRKIKEFHIELSDIVRRYIEGRYFLPAPEMTTSEILYNLSHDSLSPDHVGLVKELLFQCDMVKFAKVIPEDGECSQAFDASYKFVDETKIVIVSDIEQVTEKVEETEEDIIP